MTDDIVAIPAEARLAFAHAVVQHLADERAVDVLHVKGIAIDRSLTTADRVGHDADILVRPEQVDSFIEALTGHGWRVATTFRSGSPFEHATTLRHDIWASADLHRLFPGITAAPGDAFDRLWQDRHRIELGGLPCAVPSITAQTLLLVLNSARSATHGELDVETTWTGASIERRIDVERLVRELGAEVAFAAATGELDRFRDRRDYDLWRVTTRGGTRFEEWWARVKAAPSIGAAARVALRAPLVNTDHMATMLGRPPTRPEVVREFVARPARGIVEQMGKLRRGAQR